MEQLLTQKSTIGRALSYIGLTAIIIGVLAFVFVWSSSSYSSDTALAIMCLVSGLVSGFVFFGISDAIRLLQEIADNTRSNGQKNAVVASANDQKAEHQR